MPKMRLHSHCVLLAAIALAAGVSVALARPEAKNDLFPLAIVHINDFHARFEPTDSAGGSCDPNEQCIGGYARLVYMVKHLLEEQRDKNVLFFNGGDSYQGTLWYNVGRWNVTSQFLNMLPADAMTLGNHEFDHGVEGLVPFLETINSPMLVANIDTSEEPTMENLYHKSMILERGNRKIGVIGVIAENTYDLANTGKVKFSNESDAILEEATKLKAQGANIIIVLSHCGYDVDKVIAAKTGSVVDVIIGAHSHTFLYTGATPPGPDLPRGDYPTIVDHESGRRVLIVQAGAYAKYVGNLTVYFDSAGNVVDFEGDPIYMDTNVPEDVATLQAMQPWKEFIDRKGNTVYGENLVTLTKKGCDAGECLLGNLVSDAMVNAFHNAQPFDLPGAQNVSIALVNNRAIKSDLNKGSITYAKLIAMAPFENPLVSFDLPGAQLVKALEHAVEDIDLKKGLNASYVFLQVSGLRVTFNVTKPPQARVESVKVLCLNCSQPEYEPLVPSKRYRITTAKFIQEGGNGYTMLRDYASNLQPYVTDIEALVQYIPKISPLSPVIEDRIKIVV